MGIRYVGGNLRICSVGLSDLLLPGEGVVRYPPPFLLTFDHRRGLKVLRQVLENS
jgi:hypothetical protein